MTNLKLETLAERRKNFKHSLLIQLISQGENHKALISSYNELMRRRNVNAPVTRPVAIYHQHMLKPLNTTTVSFPGLLENYKVSFTKL